MGAFRRDILFDVWFEASAVMYYLRTPSMAGVQGSRVFLLDALVHTQVAHIRVTNLKSKHNLEIKLTFIWQKILCTKSYYGFYGCY